MQKKSYRKIYGYLLLMIFCSLATAQFAYSANNQKDFYQIKIYQLKNNEQIQQVDEFLKNAYLPALHRAGILKVGVFKPLANDTSAIKKIYVFIPFNSSDEWMKLTDKLNKDDVYTLTGKNFIEAAADHPPFERVESVLLEAMPVQGHFIFPSSKSVERIFELRDYESPTENLLAKKLQMFNEAGETEIFKRLGFNAIFYAKVISGSRMPDLMYMTSFETVEVRDAHWKNFGADAKWKEISSDPKYENNVSVSHIDSILMHSTDYSDF
ncbi:MAG: NIPSNAP family protein [Chitinophagaceae bacterium]